MPLRHSQDGLGPTHGALVALRALAAGGSGAAGRVIELPAWLAAGIVTVAIVTDRRRALPGRRLRRASRPAPEPAPSPSHSHKRTVIHRFAR